MAIAQSPHIVFIASSGYGSETRFGGHHVSLQGQHRPELGVCNGEGSLRASPLMLSPGAGKLKSSFVPMCVFLCR